MLGDRKTLPLSRAGVIQLRLLSAILTWKRVENDVSRKGNSNKVSSRPRVKPLIGRTALPALGRCHAAGRVGRPGLAYIGLDGSINFVYPQDFNIYGYGGQFGVQDGTLVGNAGFKTGWLFGAATGYSFDNGLRPEFEFGYRRNDFNNLSRSSIGLFGGAQTGNVGGFNTDTAMFNLWYDFFRTGWFHPCLGAGIGRGACRW